MARRRNEAKAAADGHENGGHEGEDESVSGITDGGVGDRRTRRRAGKTRHVKSVVCTPILLFLSATHN